MIYTKQLENLGVNPLDLLNDLRDMSNYETLMPEETKAFELLDNNQGFKVTFGNLPRVTLKLRDEQPENGVAFESPNPAFEYYLDVKVNQGEEGASHVDLHFDGRLNMMIEMMAKKPLEHFIDSIASNLQKKYVQ